MAPSLLPASCPVAASGSTDLLSSGLGQDSKPRVDSSLADAQVTCGTRDVSPGMCWWQLEEPAGRLPASLRKGQKGSGPCAREPLLVMPAGAQGVILAWAEESSAFGELWTKGV